MFLPPPNVGQRRVRKSQRCAAINPLLWSSADAGDSMIKVIRSITYGSHRTRKVTMKYVIFLLGFS